MKLIKAVASLAPLVIAASASAEDIDAPEFTKYEGKLSEDSYFEQFDGSNKELSSRWKVSHAKRDGEFSYVGQWKFEEAYVSPGFKGDKGLVLKSEAAHHAISTKFDKPFDNTNNTLVLQYEVKLQQGLTCGGAYIKLLSARDSDNEEFSNDTPYEVMFGPDRCGSNNKVHFIIRRKNPHTEIYEEKHLSVPPMSRGVKTTSLYTLIIKPDQTFEIRINGDIVKHGSLLDKHYFKPPFTPPTEIEDPEDTKPEDWVEEEMIPDPEATKPEDWDEDAPFTIYDPTAVKPDDWDEEMEEFIPDPEAVKPEGWDDEEDGEWVAPKIYNPECNVHGCGVWIAPKIRNPDFKGKWTPPLIENPAYKGEWSPRLIPNPHYYEDNTPASLQPIGGLGFELWTMNGDILFDNIYLGHEISEAEAIGNATFVPKVELEEIQAAAKAPKAKYDAEKPDAPAEIETNIISEIFDQVVSHVFDFLAEGNAYILDLLADPVTCLLNRPGEAFFYSTVFVCSLTLFFVFWSIIIYGIASLFGVPTSDETPIRAHTVTKKVEQIIDEDDDDDENDADYNDEEDGDEEDETLDYVEEEENETIEEIEGTSASKANYTEATKR